MSSIINKLNNKKKLLKALVVLLELLAFGIIIYLICLPLYPAVKYKLSHQSESARVDWQDFEAVKQKTEEIIKESLPIAEDKQNNQEKQSAQSANLPQAPLDVHYLTGQAEYAISPNRVIIAKIGVNAPIIDSADGDYGLSRGAWRLPECSSPDKGGNTVITGHRFKYLPSSNLTFYLFHKLKVGDIVLIIWQEEKYYYKIKDIKIIEPTDFSILEPTKKSTLTLFTCDPIYSQKNRLVVIGELMK